METSTKFLAEKLTLITNKLDLSNFKATLHDSSIAPAITPGSYQNGALKIVWRKVAPGILHVSIDGEGYVSQTGWQTPLKLDFGDHYLVYFVLGGFTNENVDLSIAFNVNNDWLMLHWFKGNVAGAKLQSGMGGFFVTKGLVVHEAVSSTNKTIVAHVYLTLFFLGKA